MKPFFASLTASVAALCLLSAPLQARADDQAKPMTHAEVEALVKKVIEENPELIIKTVEAFQMKQQASAMSKAALNIVSKQDELAHGQHSPVAGNPKGDLTIVEFFDYHCGYCKHFYPVLAKLIDEDKGIRVVFKEFPILSEDSELASKAALAVYGIDKSKYFPYHTALMKSNGRFDMDMLNAKAKELGISESELKKAMENPDIDKELGHNKELAQELGINGTPAIIIGTQLAPGAIEMPELKARVEQARKEAKDKK